MLYRGVSQTLFDKGLSISLIASHLCEWWVRLAIVAKIMSFVVFEDNII